jgi:hypothetical protein
MNRLFFCAIIASLLCSSCARICTVQSVGVNVNGQQIAFSSSRVPCKKVNDYEKSVKQAITAIYSDKFETWLTAYMKDSIGNGPQAKAWQNLNAKDVIQRMRVQINGEYIDTYGGIKGLWLSKIYKNDAYDGKTSGPIRLNRIHLKNRSVSSIANTIAHETSHRIGLTHPHSVTNFSIALKEPPYVIGYIIEQIVEQQINIQ